jgi:sarcosine oxidase
MSSVSSPEFDVVVVGLGAMGSATTYQLASRGQRVLGIDAFPAGHTFGSSHGETRIIRMAYFEHPNYVPLLRRAYALWRQAENESGQSLLRVTGGLFLGKLDDDIVAGSVLSARTHGLPHTMLDVGQIRRLYPAFEPQADEIALYEDAAGVLFPERCIATHLNLAEQRGARLRHTEPVMHLDASPDGVTVRTETGSYRGGRAVITLGAWFSKLLPDVPVQAERIPLLWFMPRANADQFELGKFPICIWQTAEFGDFYLTPHVALPGVKIGKHHSNTECDPAAVDRVVSDNDERPLRSFLESRMPSLAGPVVGSAVCMYENSPDLHFVVDRHPTLPNVVIGAGFSGHGFKFASVMGSLLADLAVSGTTTPDADFLRFSRLASVP